MTQEEIKEEYRKCVESFEYWRDRYFMRKRTLDDFQEVVTCMSNEFSLSLRDALEEYKKDRQMWVDWYNDNFIYNVTEDEKQLD